MWEKYALSIELTEPLLGTVPKDPEVYAAYVKTKAPVEDPDETVVDMVEVEEKGWTTFYVDLEGDPVLMDYQIKGFIKESGNIIKEELKLKALRSHIDNEVFVYPRRIKLVKLADMPEGRLNYLERPLRAMTQQGPRVTVVRSDFVPEGTIIEDLEIRVLKTSRVSEEVLRAILDYGAAKGLGQWRNGSYGRFAYTLEALQ